MVYTAQTNYRYTKLNFKDSKYRFYRLLVQSKEKPEILRSTIQMDAKIKANYSDYVVTYMNIEEANKETIIDIDLKQRLPLSYLKIHI